VKRKSAGLSSVNDEYFTTPARSVSPMAAFAMGEADPLSIPAPSPTRMAPDALSRAMFIQHFLIEE